MGNDKNKSTDIQYDPKKDKEILMFAINYFSERYHECDKRASTLAGLLAIAIALIKLLLSTNYDFDKIEKTIIIASSFLFLLGFCTAILSIYPWGRGGKWHSIKKELRTLKMSKKYKHRGLVYMNFHTDLFKGKSKIENLQHILSLFEKMVIVKTNIFVISIYSVIFGAITLFLSIGFLIFD